MPLIVYILILASLVLPLPLLMEMVGKKKKQNHALE